MQNQNRLLRVYCVLSFTCTCHWKKPVHVLLTTDSESHAKDFKADLEEENEACDKCGHVDQIFVDSAEYERKHFVYND